MYWWPLATSAISMYNVFPMKNVCLIFNHNEAKGHNSDKVSLDGAIYQITSLKHLHFSKKPFCKSKEHLSSIMWKLDRNYTRVQKFSGKGLSFLYYCRYVAGTFHKYCLIQYQFDHMSYSLRRCKYSYFNYGNVF